MIIKPAKRIFNSDKTCRSYSDLNFGDTFFGIQCINIESLMKKRRQKWSKNSAKDYREEAKRVWSTQNIRRAAGKTSAVWCHE